MNWNALNFWNTGEWQVIEEKLSDLDVINIRYCPKRKHLFKALELSPFDITRVAIFGQDPYPSPTHATGIAFSLPHQVKKYPPTFNNIVKEYCTDLHYPPPSNGSLTKWARQGVLLWNVIPTCLAHKSLSHERWTEWSYLTQEIVEKLSEKGCVMAFLGQRARDFIKFINPKYLGNVIETSHPSPLGANSGRTPFIGSRLFTSINAKLKEPINWRL